MTTLKCEYIWLDGYHPEPNLRSKTNLIKLEGFTGDPEELPLWGFDGSSTNQADGSKSDLVLKPVRCYKDPARKDGRLVMCEVLTSTMEPHSSNARATITSDDPEEWWFGFEQEYVIEDAGRPLGFPHDNYPSYPAPQGKYYCGVGFDQMGSLGRTIVEEHLQFCLDAGIQVTCINAEVLKGQREYGILSKGAKKAGDDVRIARYLMMRHLELYELDLNLSPKPVHGDWNGTGMHCNFSNKYMREQGGEEYFNKICDQLGTRVQEHIAVYGSGNEHRLTGAHETQRIDQFSYGVADRGASIRIPLGTVQDGRKGRLEDRRVAANADPYKVVAVLLESLQTL